MEIVKIIDEIENFILKGFKLPLSGKVMVEGEVLLNFLDQLRSELPDEILKAQRVSRERERVIAEARQEGERLLTQSRDHAAQLVDQTQVVQEAKRRAEEIILRTQAEVQGLWEGASDYADGLMQQLELQLEKTLVTVRKGREELSSRRFTRKDMRVTDARSPK